PHLHSFPPRRSSDLEHATLHATQTSAAPTMNVDLTLRAPAPRGSRRVCGCDCGKEKRARVFWLPGRLSTTWLQRRHRVGFTPTSDRKSTRLNSSHDQ